MWGGYGISIVIWAKDITISNNTIIDNTGTGLQGAGIVITSGHYPTAIDRIIIDSNNISGHTLGRGMDITVAASGTGGSLNISNNIMTGNLYGIRYIHGFDNVIVSNNVLTGAKTADLYLQSDVYGSNNIVGKYINYAPNGIISTINGKKILYKPSAPAVGIWSVGDIVWNSAADNVLGWKCTGAGVDGGATWKSMSITLEP